MFKAINMNFNEKIILAFNKESWTKSPASKVHRIQFEREHEETGHVTSIVRYEPGAIFSEHIHPKGEEIFVLEGTFSDESGDYPQGTYLRNPPGSSHSPFSKDGCLLFVKLNQFDEKDLEKVIINTNKEEWIRGHGGLKVMSLHSFESSGTALVKWPKGEKFIPHSHYGGEEILVLSGVFQDEYGEYPKYTWIRSPHLSTHHPYVEEETITFVKTGHLI